MPALAVVGADHQIIRSTEAFRHKCEDPAALCEDSPELDLVLRGQTDTAVIDLGDFSVAVEAVTDAAGKRSAILSLPAEDLGADAEAPVAALREAAEASPALVWAKDLEGRYLYANPRYLEDLETSEERLKGNRDADLPPVETVDGPRLRYVDDGLEEPLQLEYNVPEYESRPAMVAFRFPLRNGRGEPIATCGVAAPSADAQVARDEAARLMQLERWNRLDPNHIRAELLEQWHVQATPGPVEDVKSDPPAKTRNGHARVSLKRLLSDKLPAAEEPAPVVESAADDEESEPTALDRRLAEATEAPPERIEPAATTTAEARHQEDPVADGGDRKTEDGEGIAYHREEEWVRQLRQSNQLAPDRVAAETADALQSDLQLARKWAERADQLQGELHEAHARIREVEAEAQRAQVAAEQVVTAAQAAAEQTVSAARAAAEQTVSAAKAQAEESARLRTELEQARSELEQARADLDQARGELEREQSETEAARSEVEETRRELDAARAQTESLRGPAEAAMKLSEDLGQALAAEQKRGAELAQTLERIRARLGDLEGAVEQVQTRPKRAA